MKGKYLKKQLKELNLTQKGLAIMLKRSEQQVSYWCNDKAKIPFYVECLLANKYMITAESLVREFKIRNIKPDLVAEVKQGMLTMWNFSSLYAVDLELNSILRVDPESLPKTRLFPRTMSPQSIADHLMDSIV